LRCWPLAVIKTSITSNNEGEKERDRESVRTGVAGRPLRAAPERTTSLTPARRRYGRERETAESRRLGWTKEHRGGGGGSGATSCNISAGAARLPADPAASLTCLSLLTASWFPRVHISRTIQDFARIQIWDQKVNRTAKVEFPILRSTFRRRAEQIKAQSI